MLVEELYSSYFDINSNRLPYSSDSECLIDLLAFLDIILKPVVTKFIPRIRHEALVSCLVCWKDLLAPSLPTDI